MMSCLETNFKIPNPAWQSFKNYINETYPRSSFTHEQREFVYKYLKQDNGECSDDNKLWINYFVDQLIEFSDSWPATHEAISEQIERLKAVTAKAILGFFNVQSMLRQSIPVGNRTPQQHRLLEIHPNILNFPLELTLDMGRFLQLPEVPRFKGQDPNVKVADQHLFHQLHQFILQSSQPNQVDGGDAVIRTFADEMQSGEWDPHSSEDIFLRLCTYKVWCDKYEEENEWSVSQMLGPWLREAVQLYNKVSYHWTHCKVKRFDESQFPNIRHTAYKTWLHEISLRTIVSEKMVKPTSNWVTDWCTYPVTEKRHEWEMYFCSVILHAKNVARLLGKHERFNENDLEQDVENNQPHKRARVNEEPTAVGDEVSLETKLMHHIHHEFRHIRQMMVQLDRNASYRQQEYLRELLAYFKPAYAQLQQLDNGQHHIIRSLDHGFGISK